MLLLVGLIRILRSTGMELGRLAQQFLYLWQGTYLPVSFLNAGTQDGIECPWSQLLPQNSSPDLQIGSSDEQDLSDDFTGKFPEPTREVSLAEYAMDNEDTDNAAFAWKGEKDIIYLHTNSSEITCPCCGKKAKKVKDANTRTVQDLSLRNGIGVELKLTVGRAFCENPECANFGKCFYEQCPFAQSDRTYTTRVQYLALVTGTSSSFHDTERQMRLMGIQFGDDCVKRLLMSLQFPDEKDVTVIGRNINRFVSKETINWS